MTGRPILAILRGVTPGEVVDIGQALIAAGVERIEVPLNSPDPFASIERLATAIGDLSLIGAGTVLAEEDVEAVHAAGGRLVVAPNTDPAVIRAARARNMLTLPGAQTATECFEALRAGADGLKLFPANLIGTDGLRALRAVLPPETGVYAVGGIGPEQFPAWLAAGARGFGMGTSLYRPGFTATEVGARAARLVAAFDAASRGGVTV